MTTVSDFSWIPLALTADLPAATVIPVWTPSGRIALWRSQSGTVTATSERCPHRGMRLSYGFVRGEMLSCIYHGWSFDRTGACRKIPAHPELEPPEAIRTALQNVVEHGGVIWASTRKEEVPPPVYDGFFPLRTVMVDASPANICAASASLIEADGAISITLAGNAAKLLLNREDEGKTHVHALVKGNLVFSEQVAASRALEVFRRAAETIREAET